MKNQGLIRVFKTLLACMFVLIYVIPADIQMPFKVMLLLAFNIFTFKLTPKKGLYLILFSVGIFYCIYKIEKGSFDNSILMVLLSIGPVINFNIICKYLNIDRSLLRKLCNVAICASAIQLLFYNYKGRPNMSYEINQSASYIFLLFLYCDLIKYKIGSALSICLALPLLSRLCYLCIVLVYVLQLLKRIFVKFDFHYSYYLCITGLAVVISIFSFWYSVSMIDKVEDVSDDSSRIKNVNDTSNLLRFTMNARILTGIFDGDSKLVYEGYGDLAQNEKYRAIYSFQPHNEVIKHIAQYGVLFTFFLFFMSARYYNSLTTNKTIDYLIPIIIYTQLLWVRFTIIPSVEMIFIFYLLTYKSSLKTT